MKKFLEIFLVFIVFFSNLSAAKINDIQMLEDKFIINMSSTKETDYFISSDEDTRLIYIEINNLDEKSMNKLSDSFQHKMKKSNFFEEIEVSKVEKSLYITMQLLPKINYSLKDDKDKIELNLKKVDKNKSLVVIDPGHGGKDPGALRGNVKEKDIVLSVSKFLKDELSNDFNVIMTRNTDIFIKLSERPEIANKSKAKLFVSIHANASENTKANGVEVFYFSKKSSPYAERIANFENSFGEKYGESSSTIAQISGELAYKKNQESSIFLAKDIVNKLANASKLKNGGIHGANFAVLRGFNGTGILVELGFVSNKNDRAIITNKNYQKIMAKEIANSIREYFK